MIRWCAYCHHFLEEAAPYDKFIASYGLCKWCLHSEEPRDKVGPQKLLSITGFYEKINSFGKLPNPSSVRGILNEGFELGIRPIDLVLGIVQPALYQVGESWALGRTSVAEEHRFTAFCESILSVVYQEYLDQNPPRRSRIPQVLLVNAEGNFHHLGIRIIELFLISHSISCCVVYPGLPSLEIVEQVQIIKPQILGISVSRPEQVDCVRQVEHYLKNKKLFRTPKVIVGGYAVKSGLIQGPREGISSKLIKDLDSLLIEIISLSGNLTLVKEA